MYPDEIPGCPTYLSSHMQKFCRFYPIRLVFGRTIYAPPAPTVSIRHNTL